MPLRAKNLQDISDILLATGKKFDDPIKDVVKKNLYEDGGSGSLVVDAIKAIPKKTLRFGGAKASMLDDKAKPILKKGKPVVKKVNTVGDRITGKIDSAIDAYKQKATDLDIKAGNAVASKLKGKKSENLFISDRKFKTKSADGIADEHIGIQVPMLSAPIEKAKDKVLPFVGSMTVAGGIDKTFNRPKSKGGEEQMENVASTREDLIEKIASAITGDFENSNTAEPVDSVVTSEDGDFKKLAELAFAQTEIIKTAMEKVKEDESQISKLAAENKYFKLNLIANQRSGRAVKLANEMHEKGIIKKASIQGKIDEIMDMSDDTYEVLAETVQSLEIEKRASSDIDSISMLGLGETSKETSRRLTFQEGIIAK